MTELRSVLICGAGAVGSMYAERLQRMDPSAVGVLARGERRTRLEREGLQVNGRHFSVRCVDPAEHPAPAELVLVAVKHHHLPEAIQDLGGVVGGATILLSVMNGITSEGALGRAFGPEKILHGFVLGTDAVREEAATRYSSTGKLVFGAVPDGSADPRVAAVKRLLDRAGIPCEVPDDILREQWRKFVLNVGVNQVSAVLRAPYRGFHDVAEVRELTRLAALEAVAVGRAEGVNVTAEDVERVFPIVARLAPDGKTSMLQDVEACRKTEVEMLAGTVLELAAKHGVEAPVNALLRTMISALEGMAGVKRDL